MKELIQGRATEKTHFYTRDAEPCHTQPKKSSRVKCTVCTGNLRSAAGKAAVAACEWCDDGGWTYPESRATTAADGRKLGLLPSVTQILKVKAKPQLTNWMIDQAILATMTSPTLGLWTNDEIDQDEAVRRLREEAAEHGRLAAEEGIRIHAAWDSYMCSEPYDPEYHLHIDGIMAEVTKYVPLVRVRTEVSFAEEMYAGTIDIETSDVLGDLKTQEFDDPKGVSFYPEWAVQLAGYDRGLGRRCVSIVASRSVPGLVVSREWTEREMAKAREEFGLLLRLWVNNNYDPREAGRKEQV